jgi:hypothetical protein
VVTPDFGGRLLARTLRLLPAIRANTEVFAAAIARTGRPRRTGDTIGVLLAGAYSLHSDQVATPAQADEFVAGRGWVKDAVSHTDNDPEWRRALDFLLQITRRVGTEDIPVHELLGRSLNGGAEAENALKWLGIRLLKPQNGHVPDRVALAVNSTLLQSAFAETAWGTSWTRALARSPGATRNDGRPVRFGSLLSKVVVVPAELIL